MEFTKSFKELGKEDVAIAGGKGASLGEMTKAGISVPEGYVVLSNAFEQFIKETDLNVEIDAILDTVKHEKVHTVEEASEKIQSLILNAEMPKDIEKEILNSFDKLGANFVAVRSSATSEDSATAAWAGQLDSYLNTTKKELLENVKRCWASLFTSRAIFYRFEKKLHETAISVAVVVQKMVNSKESGIAFSVHPVTQDYNQLIIEAGFGLGEAIVQGSITPDSYVVDKQDWHIIDINVNEQSKGLFRKGEGGNEWKELGKKGKEQVLNEKEIIELSKLIIKIEKHYGFPCDIEWAKENGKFYIVQSRPITTLSKSALEEKTLVEQFKEEIGSDELLIIRGKFIPLFLLTDWLKFYDEKFKEKEDIYPVLSIKRNNIFTHFISLDKYLGISKKGIERYIKNPKYKNKIENRYNQIKKKINLFYEDYFKEKTLSEQELLNTLKKSEEYLHELVALTLFIDFLDEDIVKKTYKEKGFELDFEEIFEVSKICDFPSFDLKNNIDIVNKAKDNLTYLKHVYTGYSAAPTTEEVENKVSKINIEELKREIKKSEEEISKKSIDKKNLRESLNSDEKSVADFLGWVIEMRDDRKPLMNKLDVLFNECVRTLYEKWEIDKELSFVSYVFEVLKGKKFSLENLPNIEKRQGDFVNLYYGNNIYSEKYENLEKEFQESESLEKPRSNEQSVRGQIANKGKAIGIARIIYDPKKFHSFTEGDILVTSMTRPEFVLIMKKASAIVTNEGGIACHAAIVSRELNKPCIIGTKNATEIIRDGDLIEVDADNGVVRILEKKKILTKTFSREHSLFYYEIESDDNLKGNEIFPEYPKIQNLMIAKKPKENKVVIWGDVLEFSKASSQFEKELEQKTEIFGRIKSEFQCFNELKPYLTEEKKINSVKGARSYYKVWERAWPVMEFLMIIPELKNIDKNIREWAMKKRAETQEYADKIDSPFIDFIKNFYPSYEKYAFIMRPKELFLLEQRNLSNGEKKMLEERLQRGYVIVNGEFGFYDQLKDLLNKYNLILEEETLTQIVLTKTYSREHSLFYCYVWHNGNTKVMEKWVGKNIENILFLREDKSNKMSVWYEQEELDKFYQTISNNINAEKDYFDKILNEYYRYWKILLPYVNGEKKIKDIAELKIVYDALVEWWGPMAIIFVAVDLTDIPEDTKKKALKAREDTQEYSDTGDNLFLDFMLKNFPEYKDISYVLSPLEVFFLNNKKLIDEKVTEIKKRLGGFALLNDNLVFIENLNKELEKRNLELEKEKIEDLRILKGQTACRGLVKGKARLILYKNQISTLKEGEILVTEMTSPEFVPVMKRASAIITDEGGLTSHAAITSRELNKPCIIGTKVATQVLKDGDFVEVDANNGIVKILKKKSSKDKKKLDLFGWRDFTLVLGQIFTEAESEPLLYLDDFQLTRPYSVLERIDNKVGFFNDFKQIEWQKEEILKRIKDDKIFHKFLVEKSDDYYAKILPILNNKKPINRENLKKFTFNLKTMCRWAMGWWWAIEVLEQKKTNPEILEYLMAHRRKTETFFPDADNIIRISIESLYPQIKEFADVILVEEVIEGNIPEKKELEERLKHYLLVNNKVYTDEKIKEIKESLGIELVIPELEDHNIEGDSFTGQVAFEGKCTGRVFIVFTKKDANKFNEGDILVASQTTPDFMNAIRKAGAIITDEGGLLSHAAIVSRELKKPCIIGTKVATKLLKNGDKVEVDAIKGVVRILEKSNN